MNYRPEIDGLRALAVLPVIFFHAGFEMFSGGFVGVDVFFVISGYLIATIILAELGQGKFSIINFYERRARRILPALIFTLFFITFLSWFVLSPDKLRSVFAQLISNSLFLSNIHYALTWDYFASWKLPPLFLNTWSLAVEEQFYFIIPFLLLFLKSHYKRALSILLGLAAASIIWMNYSLDHYPIANYYLLTSRFWELTAGVLIAYIVFYSPQKISYIQSINPYWVGYLLIFLLMFFCITYTESVPYPSNWTIPIIMVTMLIIILINVNSSAGKFLSIPILVYIGKLSYPLYLLHFPLIILAKEILVPLVTAWQAGLIAIILTVLVSVFIYHFIEKNFITKVFLKDRNTMLFSSVALLLCIAIFGYIGYRGHLPSRTLSTYPELRHLVEQAPLPRNLKINDCAERNAETECELIKSTQGQNSRRFMIVGDSFAADLVSPIWGIFKEISEINYLSLRARITYACSYMPSGFGKWQGECGKARENVDKISNEDIDDIIFHISFAGHLKNKDAELTEVDLKSLTSMFDGLMERGVKVHIVGNRDTYNIEPVKAFLYPWLSHKLEQEKVPKILDKYFELWESRGAHTYLQDQQHLNVSDAHKYYRDSGHLSYLGGVNFLEQVGIDRSTFLSTKN